MRHLKTLPCLAILAALLISPARAQEKPVINIGLVDMERIFGEFYKTKLAEDEVEKVKDVIKVEVEERRKKHAGLLEEYDELVKKVKDPTLTESVRKGHQQTAEGKGGELRTLDNEMKEYAERRRKQLITQVEESKAKILNEISAKINEISTADGFHAVFDRSGLSERGFPFLVFVKDATDLTDKVIASLNADAPKTATAPKASPEK
jgi:Skp family chaperone for outer membrane proteins